MARQQENGRPWFKFPVDFFADKDIRVMRSQLGYNGVIVYQYLLCQIFREGYYTSVDSDFVTLTADDLNVKNNIVRLTINFCVKRSMFDNELYTTEHVLTSAEIQDRYQKMMKSLNRDVFVEKKFWLLSAEDTEKFIKMNDLEDYSDKSEINSDKSEINPIDKRRQEKKRKREDKTRQEHTTDVVAEAPSQNPESIEDTKETIPYQEIKELFNNICVSYSKIRDITERRRKAIRARYNDGYTLEDFKKAFEIAEESDFLKGNNDRNWKADFDWFTNESNLTKTLEGKYDNRKQHREGGMSNGIPSGDWDTYI